MVDPIGSHIAAALPSLAPTDPERPASIAEAAVRVTPVNASVGGGFSAPGGLPTAGADENSPLEKALEHVNGNLQAWSTGMRFDIDEDAQRVVVSIVDSATGEVLRTVPTDAVLRVAKMIVQLQGKSIDTRA
jgi:flagellar protein FlaG